MKVFPLIILCPVFIACLLLCEETKGLNFTLGFTTDMWYGNYYPATAIQIALDTIRSQGALLDHNFRSVIYD